MLKIFHRNINLKCEKTRRILYTAIKESMIYGNENKICNSIQYEVNFFCLECFFFVVALNINPKQAKTLEMREACNLVRCHRTVKLPWHN